MLQAEKAAPSTKQIKRAPQKVKKALKKAIPAKKLPVPSRKPAGTQKSGGGAKGENNL